MIRPTPGLVSAYALILCWVARCVLESDTRLSSSNTVLAALDVSKAPNNTKLPLDPGDRLKLVLAAA